MNEKLIEINKQLETLTSLINEYQESLLQERVVISLSVDFSAAVTTDYSMIGVFRLIKPFFND